MSKKKTDRAKILEHSLLRLTAVWGATVASPLVRNKVGQVEFCTAQQYYQVEQSSNGTFLEILPDVRSSMKQLKHFYHTEKWNNYACIMYMIIQQNSGIVIYKKCFLFDGIIQLI